MMPPDLGFLGIHVLEWYILIVLNTILHLRMGRHLGLIKPLQHLRIGRHLGLNMPLNLVYRRESHLLSLRQTGLLHR